MKQLTAHICWLLLWITTDTKEAWVGKNHSKHDMQLKRSLKISEEISKRKRKIQQVVGLIWSDRRSSGLCLKGKDEDEEACESLIEDYMTELTSRSKRQHLYNKIYWIL